MHFVFPLGARIVHTGGCGSHFKNNNCDFILQKNIMNNKRTVELLKSYWFPSELEQHRQNCIKQIPRNNFGGWSFKIDHDLCKSYIEMT